MGYQSKTWSLSDEVVDEIEYRIAQMKQTVGAGSPNRVLKELLFPPCAQATTESEQSPAARELLVELEEE